MKSPKEGKERWERTLTRYFAAYSVPLRWSYPRRRFTGVAGHLFARLNPYNEDKMWQLMPQTIRKYENERNPNGKQVVIFATNRRYGDSIDDSLVVMRMGTFIPMLKALVDSDKERWNDVTDN
jgi:protein gp37